MPTLSDLYPDLFGGVVPQRERSNEPGLTTSFKRGLYTYPAGVGRLVEDYTPFEDAGAAIREYGERGMERNPQSVTNFEEFMERPGLGLREMVGQGLGTTLPALIPYAGPVGRALGVMGAGAAGAGLSAIPTYGEIRSTQEQTGQRDLGLALGGAAASGVIEQLGGVQRLFRPGQVAERALLGVPESSVRQFATTPLRTFGMQAGRVALGEGGEELAQGPIEQYAGGQNPMEHLGETAFGGFSGFVGGLVPFGVGSGFNRAMQQRSAHQAAINVLTDPTAPFNARMQGAEIMRQAITAQAGPEQGNAWFDQRMRSLYAEEQARIEAGEYDLLGAQRSLDEVGLDNGQLFNETINPYDVGGQVSALQQGGETDPQTGQIGLFGGGGAAPIDVADERQVSAQPLNPTDQPLQGLPHRGPVMPAGAEVEDAVSRAAGIYNTLAPVAKAPGSQEAAEFTWAEQTLRAALGAQRFEAFKTMVGQQVVARAGASLPRKGTTAPNTGTPTAAGPKTFGTQFKEVGGINTNVRKALDAAQTPEQAVEILRTTLEKPTIASSTIKAAEAMHKQLTGETYGQYKRRLEAAEALQKSQPQGAANVGSSQAVLAGNGPTETAGSGAQVQGQAPASSERQVPAAQEAEGEVRPRGKAAVHNWLLEQIGKRDQRKADVLFRMSQGEEFPAIAKAFGISTTRVKQLAKEAQEIYEDLGRRNFTAADLVEPEEQEVIDEAPDGSRSNFGNEVSEGELASSQQADGAGEERGVDGFSIRKAKEVNSDNVFGERAIGKDGKPTGNPKPTKDAAHNDTVAELERAAVVGDADEAAEVEAIEAWDAFVEDRAHKVASGAQKDTIKPWKELTKTERGQQTQRDWLAFFAKSKSSPNPGVSQMARISKLVKDTYHSLTGGRQGRSVREWGELNPVDPTTNESFLRALQPFFANGLGGLLNERIEGIYVPEKYARNGVDAQVMRIGQRYVVILSQEIWHGALEDGRKIPQHLVQRVMSHELHHVIDDVENTREFSNDPELRIFGDVWNEIASAIKKEPGAFLLFQYPLDGAYLDRFSRERIEAELYAQIMSAYDVPKARVFMQEVLPLTTAYAEAKYAEITAKHSRPTETPHADARSQQAGQPTEGLRSRQVSGAQDEPGRSGRSFASQGVLTSYPAELAPTVSLAKEYAADAVRNWAKKGLQAVVFAHDLADIAVKEGLASAKDFFALQNKKGATRTHLEAEVDRILTDAANTSDRQMVSDFVRKSTKEGKWGYQPKWRDQVEVDPAMAAAYNRLSAAGKAVADEMFKYGEDTYKQKQALVNKQINDEFNTQSKAATTEAERAEIERERARKLRLFGRVLPKLQGPYAPLKRFGDYVTIAKSARYIDAEQRKDQAEMEELQGDPTHYVVEFYESYPQSKRRERELQGQFPGGRVQGGVQKQKMYQEVQELPWSAIAKVKHAIEDLPDDEPKRAMNRLITDLYLTMLSESSARKTELKRRLVEGEHKDMFRAFAAQGRADAHFIAALQHNEEIQNLITNMRSEANDPEGNRDNRSRVFNEIMARFAQGLDYRPTPISNKIMRATSWWMLITSPAYYLQNATQPFMLTLPMLNGRFGAGTSWQALLKAYKDVFPYVKHLSHELDIAKLHHLSADERQMLETMRDQGKLDITIAMDLGRWSEKGVGANGPTGKVLRAVEQLPQKAEIINRVTSALAAYRLSNKNLDYTGKVLDLTHGNYGAANAPRMFNTPIGKVVLQFRKFQLIQVSLLGRLMYDAFKGASPPEKAITRATLKWIAAHHMVMAGALGLPAANMLGVVVAALGGDDDEPLDIQGKGERQLREMIGDKDLADLILKGLPAWAGMDVSSRIGMGNAFSLLPFADYSKLLDRKTAGEVAMQAAGPFAGGLLPKLLDGAGLMVKKGEIYKGMEMMLPKGLQDVMKAYRFASDGITQRNNDVVMSAEELSLFDVMSQLVGLPSTKLTERQRLQGDVIEVQNYYKGRVAQMRHAYAKAYRENDAEDMAELRTEWKAVAEAMKRNGLKPSPLSNLLKAPQEQKKREKITVGGVQGTKSNRRFLEQQSEQ